MRVERSRARVWFVFLAVVSIASVTAALGGAGEREDPLAAELERWSAFAASPAEGDGLWKEIKEPSESLLARARDALAGGRRLLALQRLAAAREQLSAWSYVLARSAEARQQLADFEAEWTRMGDVLRGDLGPPAPDGLASVRPAAVRSLGEAALAQVRVYYEASVEYGRNTMPEYGLFYLGAAQAQREFAALCRTLPAPAPQLAAPPVRAMRGELEALEAELLSLYRPPASIEKHREFILASGALKEAGELERAGLRYGALLRYLQAAQRVAALRPSPPALEGAGLSKRLRELDARLASPSLDHSLGRLFLEAAEAELATAAPGPGPASAPAIAADVLPRYFAALEPAAPASPPAPETRVTVTLVRWPYT